MPTPANAVEAKKKPKPTNKAQVGADGAKAGTRAVLKPIVCSESCFVGLLDKHATASFKAELAERGVAKPAPKEGEKELTDDEAAAAYIEKVLSLDTEEFHMNLFGLRRKNSVTNVFDDVVVMLFRVPIKEGDGFVIPVTPLGPFPPAQGSPAGPRRTVNEEAAKAFVDEVAAADKEKGFPWCGDEVHCKDHGYWRVVAFANTTDPGYGPGSSKSSHDVRDVPWGIAAAETGQLTYRCGFHHFGRLKGYVAGQATGAVSAKRRYPLVRALDAARLVGEGARRKALKVAAGKQSKEIQDLAAAKAKERALAEFPVAKPDVSRTKRTKAEADYKPEEFDAECERRWPEVGPEAQRKAEYAELSKWLNGQDKHRKVAGEVVRVEEASGASKRDFEKEKAKSVVVRLDPTPTADGGVATSPRFVLDIESEAGAKTVLPIGKDDVLVTRTTAEGTNFHRSVDRVKPGQADDAKRAKNRTVGDYSEGCQVFRDPDDFYKALRLLQLSKRVRCTARSEACTAKVTLAEYRKHGALGNDFDADLLNFPARVDVLDSVPKPGHDKTDPAPAIQEPIEALRGDATKTVKASIGKYLGKKPLDAVGARPTTIVEALLAEASRTSLDVEPPAKPTTAKEPKPGSKEEKAALKVYQDAKKAAVKEAAKSAVVAAHAAWEADLVKARTAWLEKNRESMQEDKLKLLVADHAEHCDFAWQCRTYFPYTLVDLGEPEIRELLAKLPSYSYDKLFPAGLIDKLKGPAERSSSTDDGDDD